MLDRNINITMKYAKLLASTSLKQMTEELTEFIRFCSYSPKTKQEISSALESKQVSQNASQIIAVSIAARYSDLKQIALNDVDKISKSHLVDFDWKIQVSFQIFSRREKNREKRIKQRKIT